MRALLTQLAQDESGATAIEYGLIGVLISVAIIIGATALGSKLGELFTAIVTNYPSN